MTTDTKMITIPSNCKALIFDIDGTLADSMPIHYLAWRKHAAKVGIDFTVELFNEYAGIPVVPTFEMLAERFDLKIDAHKLGMDKESEFESNMDKIRPVKVVMDIVEKYWDTLPIAFGTGGERHIAEKTLKVLGLEEKMEFLVSSQDVVKHKPHPETFLKAAELINVDPKDCLVFEDGIRGIEAAEAAGMQWIDVTKYYETTIGRDDLWSIDE